MKMFNILNSCSDHKKYPLPIPKEIPWEIVEPHEKQALNNHCGQSLQKLHNRGGLCPGELWYVLHDKPITRPFVDFSTAVDYIICRIQKHGNI